MRLEDWLTQRLKERLRQAGNDIRFIRQRLAGHEPSPLIERSRRPRYAPVLGRPARIRRVVQETPEAVSLYLEGPSLLHVPGQFLSFEVVVGGKKYRRAYSLANLPGNPPHVTIKRVREGTVSNYLNDEAAVGDTFTVLGPSGAFTLAPSETRSTSYVLIAGGSGITPIMSISHAVLDREPASHVHLIYGNRSEAEIIFADRLEGLTRAHPDRLTLHHVLESEGRRLDREITMELLDAIAPPPNAEFFVCGPAGMMDSVRDVLRERNVSLTRVHEERFASPEQRRDVESSEPQPLHITVDGRGHAIRAAANETLLDAGLGAGVPLPFSCAMGGCAACKVRLVEGNVATDEPNCLTDQERADGWVLACCSRPLTPCRFEVP